ncbi:MAG: hypothetical protein JOZ54_23425 [Acidobacteria bacterium]|nr:hypothetical protein [Acidobacteriota bacterium]
MQISELFSHFREVRPLGTAVVPIHECILAMALEKRDLIEWCWAAVTASIFRSYETANKEQCAIVKASFTKCANCCEPRSSNDVACCNNTNDLLASLENHLGAFHTDGREHVEEFVKQCIDAGFPLIARIGYGKRDAGHYVIVRGYRIMQRTGFEVHVDDPDALVQQPTPMPFAHFLSYYAQKGKWDVTYETKPHPTLGLRRIPTAFPCT